MSFKNTDTHRTTAGSHWAWLIPILALSPLALAAKGCDNTGVVGNNCPTAEDCSNGSAGKGSGPTGGCGGLLNLMCAQGQYCDSGPHCGAADDTGVCRAKPTACDLDYSPVCGCNGETYGNACAAQMAGMSVTRAGECGDGSAGEPCGGLSSSCDGGLYCNYAIETQCGGEGQAGVCTPMGSGCTKELNEVCGCDEKTYGNPCMAGAAGVSVAHQGACKPTVVACGEIGGCATGEFCNFPPESNCGLADGPGVCTKLPGKDAACDANYAPVCGCDGKTYGNDCEALVAGVSVASAGACDVVACGEIGGCATGEFCNFPPESNCGFADGPGSCMDVPDACPANVDPVCGCDGKDYGNACTAYAKGVSVSYEGPCKE